MRGYTRSFLVLARTLSARVEGFERTLPASYQVLTVQNVFPGSH
jgi:hypothetical protein